MTAGRHIYRVVRSVIFSLMLTVMGLYLLCYVIISIPAVQNLIRERAEVELSKLLGGHVEIGKLNLHPFNEVMLTRVSLSDPQRAKCLEVDRLGAGINLWRLISRGEIEITYAEIIGMNAMLWQEQKDGPLNIQFLIDALSPKDKNKPPTRFDLNVRQVVIRKSTVSFDRRWQPRRAPGLLDVNHLKVENLRADISLPRIKNDDFRVNVKRLSLDEASGLQISRLSLMAHVTNREISVSDFELQLPQSSLRINDQTLHFDGYKDIAAALKRDTHKLVISNAKVTPSDLKCFYKPLANFNDPLLLDLQASGNEQGISIENLEVQTLDERLALRLSGRARDFLTPAKMSASISRLDLLVGDAEMEKILSLQSGIPAQLRSLGGLHLTAKGKYDAGRADLDAQLTTRLGLVETSLEAVISASRLAEVSGVIDAKRVDLNAFLPDKGFGLLTANIAGDVKIAATGSLAGNLELHVPEFWYRGVAHSNIDLLASGSSDGADISLSIDDIAADLTAQVNLTGLKTRNYAIDLEADIRRLYPSSFGLAAPGSAADGFSGLLSLNAQGRNIDDITGSLHGSDLKLRSGSDKCLTLNDLSLQAYNDEGERHIDLDCDWLSANISGRFAFSKLKNTALGLLDAVLPSFVDGTVADLLDPQESLAARILIKQDNELTDYLHLPIQLLTDIPIDVRLENSVASLSMDVPYLPFGKDKLIKDISVRADIDAPQRQGGFKVSTWFPVKHEYVELAVEGIAALDALGVNVSWDYHRSKDYKGTIALLLQPTENYHLAEIEEDESAVSVQSAQVHGVSLGGSWLESGYVAPTTIPTGPATKAYTLRILPTTFSVAGTVWKMDDGLVRWDSHRLSMQGVRASHAKQFVTLHGVLSADPADRLQADLQDIDLDYIFETLNINYVTFGGRATGSAWCSGLFGGDLQAQTEGLHVTNLTYNGGLLGDADLKGAWHNAEKRVSIGAEIAERGRHTASVDGGIWLARDSLSFAIQADSVNVRFMQPFMAAFSSDFNGRASGNCKLFGTFADIDLTGRIHADSVSLLVDYTNVRYHGADSVYLDPGLIRIPDFKLYDEEGNSAMLEGKLTHRYFHDPVFDFKVKDAHGLLCYNTNPSINPDWYGHIYGSGGGVIKGSPGIVSIMADMTIAPHSTFTFVLSDTQAAQEYTFLSFTDKRKEYQELQIQQIDTVPEIIKKYQHVQRKVEAGPPSIFSMDIRATVTPQAEMTLVMDPVAGDKIRAYGNGALQLGYNSASDELTMQGRYTIERGTYNFSLQDIILKDFTIRPGSMISFNGDPYRARLDIDGVYRVNTSLTDLDKSFATDRDLNRTNVPVEAVLQVRGEMTAPDISFDIELPTLTQDVARKVKSIISTDDMMNRQIVYLLALNRFSTPEYMGSSGNGSELASVASATIGSQLGNALSALTDKVTVSPQLRTERGDFSDMEVDLALSSRLLNNRLLINGNFGYRDRSTSSTTFIGDFDLEYLLSPSGTWRLKAYNRFNDQNYWLRQALTTQGIGIMYRRDFDEMFKFLKKKKK